MKLKEYTILRNGIQVISVYEIGDGYYVPTDSIIELKESDKICDTRIDALYFKMIRRLKKGTPLSNYKKSKNYEEYVERLKKEYPEYLV